MIAFFRTILGLIVTMPVAVFCGLNVGYVDVTYSPFYDSISLPFYAVILGFALLGVLFGAFSTWLNAAPLRKERKEFKRQIKTLEKELRRWQEQKGSKEDAKPVKIEKEVPVTVQQDK